MKQLIVFLVLALCLVNTCYAIKCYSCRSTLEPHCADEKIEANSLLKQVDCDTVQRVSGISSPIPVTKCNKVVSRALAIRCYQCSSDQDAKGHDSCGAYKKFNKTEHIPIECNSDESHMPGSFCMKVVQQGPRGFIWDGRWRQVIRRCASVSDTGVTGVCNWGVYENGVYWEECYCANDSCNGASALRISVAGILLLFLGFLMLR